MGLVGDGISAGDHASSSDTAVFHNRLVTQGGAWQSLLLKLTAMMPLKALQEISERLPGRQQSVCGSLHSVDLFQEEMRNPEAVIRAETAKIRIREVQGGCGVKA